jgi:hypothetical protein
MKRKLKNIYEQQLKNIQVKKKPKKLNTQLGHDIGITLQKEN